MALQTHRMIENRGSFINEEFLCGDSASYPGMLLMLNAAGEAVVHNLGETVTPLMIADLDALQGDIQSTVFTDANQVPVTFPSKGSVVNVLVQAGDIVAIGSKLASAGDGHFMVVETATSGSFNAGILVEATEGQATALAAATLVACRVI